VVAIAAGVNHSLALKADRTVVGWGNNSSQQRTPPAGLQNVVAVAAGYYHSLALKGNGTVVGWGLNDHGQATGVRPMFPPYTSSGATVTLGGQPLTNVVAIVE
jgi:alpha-tubulin suppressor-like RCC1 family protein